MEDAHRGAGRIHDNVTRSWCCDDRLRSSSLCRSNTPSVSPKFASNPRSPVSATVLTADSQTRSMALSGPRSFTGVARLAASPQWNTPAANGSTGSTPAPCWNRSETSHRQRPKPLSTQFWKMRPWPRSLHYLDSGKPWGCVCDLARSQIIAWKVFAE